jgi:GT2 family glycosyltransferase
MISNLSVVIPVYGQYELLDKLLKSISIHVPKKKIIIVDDNSEDEDTKKYLREKCKSYRVYMKPENSGFADSVNFGVSKVNTKYVAILNSDVEIPKDQDPFNSCVDYMEADPSIGLCGIKLVMDGGVVQHAGVYMDWSTERPRHRGGRDSEVWNVAEFVPFVTAAFWVLPKSVYYDIGGLPVVYGRGYFEDADFCVQLRGMGKKILYNGKTWAWHWAHKSFAAISYPYSDTSDNLYLWRRRCSYLQRMLERGAVVVSGQVDLDVDKTGRYNYFIGPMYENRSFLYGLVKLLRPNTILELGVEYGGSYFTWAQAIKDLGLGTKLTGIDTWEGSPEYGHYGGNIWDVFMKNKMENFPEEQFQTKRGLFSQFKDDIPDNSVDILMIDGSHTVEAVKRDYEQYIPKLAENGVVIFHDTNHPGWGVKDFWWGLSCQFPSYNHSGRFGLGLLFPKGDKKYHGLIEDGYITDYYLRSILPQQPTK